jgi:uncharacterized protein (TIGR02001 family)
LFRLNSPRITRALPWQWLLLTLSAPACHADSPWSASIGATTDYVFRGVSQTYDSAAVQLGGSYQSPFGWFAGVWGSNVNPYPHYGASVEVNLYGGLTTPVSEDFSTRIAYTHYAYLDDPRPVHYDYDEIAVSALYLDRLAATLSYDPDYTGFSDLGYSHRRPIGAFELTGRWPLRGALALNAGAGYYDLQRLFGVSYWAANAGLSYVYRRLTLEVDHFFTQGTVSELYEEQSANGTWTVSALLRF